MRVPTRRKGQTPRGGGEATRPPSVSWPLGPAPLHFLPGKGTGNNSYLTPQPPGPGVSIDVENTLSPFTRCYRHESTECTHCGRSHPTAPGQTCCGDTETSAGASCSWPLGRPHVPLRTGAGQARATRASPAGAAHSLQRSKWQQPSAVTVPGAASHPQHWKQVHFTWTQSTHFKMYQNDLDTKEGLSVNYEERTILRTRPLKVKHLQHKQMQTWSLPHLPDFFGLAPALFVSLSFLASSAQYSLSSFNKKRKGEVR